MQLHALGALCGLSCMCMQWAESKAAVVIRRGKLKQTMLDACVQLLGFLICSVSVWIEERRSRAQFLRLTAAAAGVDVAALDRRLRLAPDEGAAVCSFNPRAAWQRFLLLLPLLAALLWLLVTEAAAHWVPHVPGGGLGQCPAAAAP